MREDITFVGMDTSKKTIHVAILLPNEKQAKEWQAPNSAQGIKKLIQKLKKEAQGLIRACYEAGPCGYVLRRRFEEAGLSCVVVAPSLVPVKPGDRVKTDRRDAKKLAQFLRSGTLTEVRPPTTEDEAVRDLCRCRDDARGDLGRARHRLGKLLLRRGLEFLGKAWTKAHRDWLRTIRASFEHKADQVVFDDYIRSIELLEERLKTLQKSIDEVSKEEPYAKPVGWLRCFRGIDTITAMTIVAELHDFTRFATARDLMSYLGLTPSEYSTGGKSKRGPITKSGNRHVRRLLIESAWHYRHKPGAGASLRKRREGQPGWAVGLADRAQSRLHWRYWKMVNGGKPNNKAVTAVARELAGFVWATLHLQERAEPRDRVPKKKTRSQTKVHSVIQGRLVLQQARKSLPRKKAVA